MNQHVISIGEIKIFLLEFDHTFNEENYLFQLNSTEILKYNSFLSKKRKQEFVATRILKNEIFPNKEIQYYQNGAPFIENEVYISISHGQNLVGIAVNNDFEIGFDIEKITSKVLILYPKFLNKHEQELIDIQEMEELIASWSMKECLYKLSGEKKLDFKTQLLLLNRESNQFIAKILLKDKKKLVNLTFVKFKNFIISINNSKAIDG